MQVSNGRPHILTSNQRGRGQDPVTVVGKSKFAVAVNIAFLLRGADGRVAIPRQQIIALP
jgi:hypothetical protein